MKPLLKMIFRKSSQQYYDNKFELWMRPLPSWSCLTLSVPRSTWSGIAITTNNNNLYFGWYCKLKLLAAIPLTALPLDNDHMIMVDKACGLGAGGLGLSSQGGWGRSLTLPLLVTSVALGQLLSCFISTLQCLHQHLWDGNMSSGYTEDFLR